MLWLPNDPTPVRYCEKTPYIYCMGAHLSDFIMFASMMGNTVGRILVGQKAVTFGKNLVIQLLYSTSNKGPRHGEKLALLN